ncbi:uncharacterized protein VTP21DRAFT_3110 [Calcarisporiella thermophila]|uniref:uncharacterized protein n=1 Tax=Calcarisporiella thermophila TaxID=911321 RepID=UPI003742DA86
MVAMKKTFILTVFFDCSGFGDNVNTRGPVGSKSYYPCIWSQLGQRQSASLRVPSPSERDPQPLFSRVFMDYGSLLRPLDSGSMNEDFLVNQGCAAPLSISR